MTTSAQFRRVDERWRDLAPGPPHLPPDRWPSAADLRFAAGDLVRVRDGERERMLVFVSGDPGCFLPLSDPPAPARSWADFWEGAPRLTPSAVDMLRCCGPVHPRRVILAACDIARSVLASAPCADPRPVAALDAAWRLAAAFDGPPGELRRARDEAKRAGAAAFVCVAALPRTTSTEAAVADAAMAAMHAADAAEADPAEAAARCAVAAVASFDGGLGNPHLAAAALSNVVRRRIPLRVLAHALVGGRGDL